MQLFRLQIVSQVTNRQVRVWDSKSNKLIRHPIMRHAAIRYQSQMTYFASILQSSFKMWTIDQDFEIFKLQQIDRVNAAEFCSNTNQLVIGKEYDTKLTIYNIFTQKSLHYNFQKDQEVKSLGCSLIGNLVACGLNSNKIKILNLRKNKLIFTIKMKDSVQSIQFSPKGDTLAFAYGGKLKQYNVTNRQSRQLKSHMFTVFSIQFSSDGKYIATLDENQNLLVQSVLKDY